MKRLAVLALLLCGCQTIHEEKPDWNAFYEHQPTSILVLPALNETNEAGAPLAFSSTITRPLVGRGYYVFPVQPTLALLEENGIYEGGQLEAIEPQKFHEILGVDALLCVTLQTWDTDHVSLDYRLVDARTGGLIWERCKELIHSSNTGGGAGGGGLALLFAVAVLSAESPTSMACQANALVLDDLPPGPLSEEHARRRADLLAGPKR